MLNRLASTIILMGSLLLLASGCDLFKYHPPDDSQEPTVSLYAEGLVGPIGIERDKQGRLWVGEQGTGNDDSRLSVVTTDGEVYPFLTGFPSEVVQGDPIGIVRAYFTEDEEELLFFQGEGTDPLSMHLFRADPTGFTPGDAPLNTSDVEVVANIGDFVLSEEFDFTNSNPYAMAVGPNGDQFIVDAGANALLRRDHTTGELSVFARFADLENPTPVGPPMIDAVPTDVIFADGKFYVSTLTGFPFPEGQARIYEVDRQGHVSVFKRGFTTLVDLVHSRRDGALLALQIGRFDPGSGFQPQTGQLLKVHRGEPVDTLVSELNLASGMHAGAPGEVFVSSLADGEILRVDLR